MNEYEQNEQTIKDSEFIPFKPFYGSQKAKDMYEEAMRNFET